MSVQELKIRGELEMKVEKDLEEEIKDGIYHLALKLHQLYQDKKPKHFEQKSTCREYMSEVNINIRMEGGTIIQVKEIKKQGPGINRPHDCHQVSTRCSRTYADSTTYQMKFNWEKSLRNESNPSIRNEKMLPKKSVGYVYDSSTKHGCAGNSTNLGLKNEVLRLGWKY